MKEIGGILDSNEPPSKQKPEADKFCQKIFGSYYLPSQYKESFASQSIDYEKIANASYFAKEKQGSIILQNYLTAESPVIFDSIFNNVFPLL